MNQIPEHGHKKDIPVIQPPKIEAKMKRIVKQLQTTPNVQIACQYAGVSRATYYRWRANDNGFAHATDMSLESGKFLVNDMAESQLIRKVKNGEMSAIRFWLSHNHPNYSREEIEPHSHLHEIETAEEKHRKKARGLLRLINKVLNGAEENISREVNDEQEKEVAEKINRAIERFGLTDD